MDEDYIIPGSQLSSNGTNLLIVLGWVLLLAWIYRIMCQFLLLHRLNVAITTGQVAMHIISTPRQCPRPHSRPRPRPRPRTPAPGGWARPAGAARLPPPSPRSCSPRGALLPPAPCSPAPYSQVVRLQTSHMTATERNMLFGEMSTLWRTNMQQQLLRARRISCAIDVTQLQVLLLRPLPRPACCVLAVVSAFTRMCVCVCVCVCVMCRHSNGMCVCACVCVRVMPCGAARLLVCVDVFKVPFVIDKSSVKVVLNEAEAQQADAPTLGVTFKYRCTERVALQVVMCVCVCVCVCVPP